MPKIKEYQHDRDVFRYYHTRQQSERERENENWRLYDGTNYGQYNSQAVKQAVQEGRPLSTFNLAKKAVDTTTGSILGDPFEVKWETELGDDIQAAILFNELYLEDKDFMGYDRSYDDFVRAGFIYRGTYEIFKDRIKDRRGRVGVRYWPGDRVMYDPNWRTSNINDNKNIFTFSWMYAQEVKDKYNKSNAAINEAIRLYEAYQGGEAIETADGEEDKIFDNNEIFVDQKEGRFLVLDKYFLKKVKYYDVFAQGEILATLPYEEADLVAKSYRLQGIKVRLLEKEIMECWRRTTVPGLNLELVLFDGKHDLQLDGYPFLWYSSDHINSRPNTYIDILKDPQISFNKRENTATHILMTSANNALLIESDAVEDEDEIDKIGRGRNMPGFYSKVEPGAISQNKIKHLEHGNAPNEAFGAAEHIRNIMRELTPAVPAVQAIGERQQSGVLFQSMVQQAMVALQRPTKLLKIFWEEFGEKYMLAAKQTYIYPMTFTSSRTKDTFVLNVPGGIDMRTVPRLKLNITQAPTSETYRKQLLQSYLAIAQYLKDPYTLAELSRIVIGSLPGIPREETDQLQEAAKLSSLAQRVALESQIGQMQQQQGQPQGQPGQAPQAKPGPGDASKLLEGIVQSPTGV